MIDADTLAPHYTHFRVAERLLLTGHSHQAWPDVGLEAHQQAWLDAAEWVDGKWDRVMEQVARVCRGYAVHMGDDDGHLTLASNTHELVVRFLSALPLEDRPQVVTTDAEFHSLRRQLDRLAEERWIEVVKVPGYPVADVADRLAAAVDGRTAAVMVSAVFYERGHRVPGLDRVAQVCARHGAELLVDAYHALGAMPFRLADHGLEEAFVVGGGYKYLQLGEGVCFLRTPAECALRPRITGWFAEFDELAEGGRGERVAYATGGARFAGSTFDPTSAYRAAAVMDFFDVHGLDGALLREISQHQVGLLADTFRALGLPPERVALDGVALEDRGGFLALDTPDAGALVSGLRRRGVHTDARGTTLRFGPAPYLTDAQIVAAMEALGEVAGEPSRPA